MRVQIPPPALMSGYFACYALLRVARFARDDKSRPRHTTYEVPVFSTVAEDVAIGSDSALIAASLASPSDIAIESTMAQRVSHLTEGILNCFRDDHLPGHTR